MVLTIALFAFKIIALFPNIIFFSYSLVTFHEFIASFLDEYVESYEKLP